MYKVEEQEVTYRIEQSRIKDEYTVAFSKGDQTQYVLSKYRPRDTLQKYVDIKVDNREQLWIIMGFGFGYLIEALIEQSVPVEKIFVVEPNTELLEEQFKKVDLKKFEGIGFFTGDNFKNLKESIAYRVDLATANNIRILEHPHYKYMYLKYYQQVVDIIAEVRIATLINKNTYEAIGDKFIQNVVNNALYINDSYDLKKHYMKYKNIPALIVSAGPSLDKNINEIKNFKGIVFCVGRTVEQVQALGGYVDFSVVIDYSEKIRATFGEEITIPLIASVNANHQVIQDCKAPVYPIEGEDIFEPLIDVEIPNVSFGGSVATLCLSSAYYMGCEPIVFVGQDLAYTGMKEYASDCDIFSSDITQMKSQQPLAYKMVEGYYGNKEYTSRTLLGFLRWIEDYILENPNRQYINATEGGAKIKGTIQMTLKEVNEKYSFVEKPLITHEKLLDHPINVIERLNSPIKKLEELSQLADKGKLISENLIKVYRDYKGEKSNKLIRKYLDQLDQLEQDIDDTGVGTLIEYTFQVESSKLMLDEKYYDSIEKDDIDNAITMAVRNYELYKVLKRVAEQIKQYLKDKIIEMEGSR